jgi:hypothetical protein
MIELMKQAFCNHYESQKGVPFIWAPNDYQEMEEFGNKLLELSDNPDFSQLPFRQVDNLFLYIMKAIKGGWYFDNLSVRILNRKFNEIINLLRNENGIKQGIARSRLRDLYKTQFGIGSNSN